MKRTLGMAGPITGPAPVVLDAAATQRAIDNIVYQFNLLAEDVDRYRTDNLRLEGEIAELYKRSTDLADLIAFLEHCPGADIKDWARYEQVKSRLQKAARNADKEGDMPPW